MMLKPWKKESEIDLRKLDFLKEMQQKLSFKVDAILIYETCNP